MFIKSQFETFSTFPNDTKVKKMPLTKQTDENADPNNVRMVFKELNKILLDLKKRQPQCAICLNNVESRCYLNKCLHSYCMRCVAEWAHQKQTCPSCNQPFASAYYNVRSVRCYQVRDFSHITSKGKGNDPNNNVQVAHICLLRTMNSINSYFEIKDTFGKILRKHKLTFEDFHSSVVTISS
ncbi:hypothetical protein V9T40_013781 [Parthenolecanium corni]|uniref:RING-type E3 ubiquitin transferase n=1 Tax=Parthenolecanium corni TaxID=536013 RepID=A0AAN9TBL6_9HEMI